MLVITVANKSGLANISDYEVNIAITSGANQLRGVAAGMVYGHRRDEGWEELLRKIADSPYMKEL